MDSLTNGNRSSEQKQGHQTQTMTGFLTEKKSIEDGIPLPPIQMKMGSVTVRKTSGGLIQHLRTPMGTEYQTGTS
ncbi:hypothetical protein SAMN04487948_11665 [Halogranum amylolyticum]|uniref:Uncharacterized protein n=1 Tax=Halogranum amylolyticum TaxID=660520 RepID=A0A1H8VFX3_9EURY|nr:hypothetical protein SAMN04487948_11665 [Halogranum amylolyticum]